MSGNKTGQASVAIKNADMPEEMQALALLKATEAMSGGNTTHKEVAQKIRQVFEKEYRGTWHCIVGKNFGSYVTYETKNFIYMTYNAHDHKGGILLFKSG